MAVDAVPPYLIVGEYVTYLVAEGYPQWPAAGRITLREGLKGSRLHPKVLQSSIDHLLGVGLIVSAP